MEQRIVCAALKLDDKVICGVRHWDKLMRTQMDPNLPWEKSIQGFVDNYGYFHNRQRAFLIAKAANQLKRVGSEDILTSEDIY